jgi:hypothetical protein
LVYGFDASSGQPRQPLVLEGDDEAEVRNQAAEAGMVVEEVEPVRLREKPRLRSTGNMLLLARHLVAVYGANEATLEQAVSYLEQQGPEQLNRELGVATSVQIIEEVRKLVSLLPPETRLASLVDSGGVIDLETVTVAKPWRFTEQQKAVLKKLAIYLGIVGAIGLLGVPILCFLNYVGDRTIRDTEQGAGRVIGLLVGGILALVFGLLTLVVAGAYSRAASTHGSAIEPLMQGQRGFTRLYGLQVLLMILVLAIWLWSLFGVWLWSALKQLFV